MTRTARALVLAGYAAVIAAWLHEPPPRYERPVARHRPAPPVIPREDVEPDAYRGSSVIDPVYDATTGVMIPDWEGYPPVGSSQQSTGPATPWWDGGKRPVIIPRPGPTPASLHPPSVVMEPADLWAIANLTFEELPPLEYDHAPALPVSITDVSSEAELRRVCGWTTRQTDAIMVGCSMPLPKSCKIYLGPPQTDRTGVTRNLVLRHEIGHCNGWPGDHAGAR